MREAHHPDLIEKRSRNVSLTRLDALTSPIRQRKRLRQRTQAKCLPSMNQLLTLSELPVRLLSWCPVLQCRGQCTFVWDLSLPLVS